MEEQEKQFQEMQFLEQNLQNILMQKQAFQMELAESESALKEIKESKDDVYKIIGNLMIKTDKKKMQEELETKSKLLETRLKSLDAQEEKFSEKLTSIRDEMMNSPKK
jgi:prefoldin beta subunit